MNFNESKENGPHKMLSKLIGEWSGPTITWFEPEVVADESPMRGKITSLLDGRFVLHEYRGELQGKAFEGMSILGFDIATGNFQAAWVDSFHMSTGIFFAEGARGENFSAFGTYFTGPETPRWGWRTEVTIVDDDNIVLTAYNVTPDGVEAKATETRYSRIN